MTSPSSRYPLGSRSDTFRRYRLFNDAYAPGTAQVVDRLAVPRDATILEVGCGIGDTACYFAERVVPEGHVTAFDPAEELVEIGRQHAQEAGLTNVRFLATDAQSFDFESEHWDLAHTRYVLSYLPDAGDIVARIFGALKPGGWFLGEEIAQLYVRDGETAWYAAMCRWFAQLIEAGGGCPDYGIERLPADMRAAGFAAFEATAFWPTDDVGSTYEMLRLALSREMKQNLVDLGAATGDEVDAVIEALASPREGDFISPSAAIQVLGRKP